MPHIIYIFFLGVASGLRALTALAVVCWLAWARLLPVHGFGSWTAGVAVAAALSLGALVEDGWAARDAGMRSGLESLAATRAGVGVGKPVSLAARLLCAGLIGAVGAGCVYQPAAGGVVGAWAGVAAGLWLRPRLRAALAWVVGPGRFASLLESTGALWLAFAWAVQLGQTSRALLRAPFI